MGKRGQHYDDTFQRETVDHWIRSGKSARQVARDMDVSEHTLRSWKKKHFSEEGGPQQINLQDEVTRMRLEIAELREERDILKKSVAIFLKPRK